MYFLLKMGTSFFKVTFWFPTWRSRFQPWKGHKNGSKQVTLTPWIWFDHNHSCKIVSAKKPFIDPPVTVQFSRVSKITLRFGLLDRLTFGFEVVADFLLEIFDFRDVFFLFILLEYSVSQWPIFKPLGITCLIRKIQRVIPKIVISKRFHYIYLPGTPMTSIFEGQPPKTRSFPTKTRVIWVPGIEWG